MQIVQVAQSHLSTFAIPEIPAHWRKAHGYFLLVIGEGGHTTRRPTSCPLRLFVGGRERNRDREEEEEREKREEEGRQRR